MSERTLLLGKQVPVQSAYAPQLLYPIPRAQGRSQLPVAAAELAFFGEDIWHAYELSWLDENHVPQVRVAQLLVPATSPNLVESKSLKLYLNSLNQTRFDSEQTLLEILQDDVSAVVGAAVEWNILPLDAPEFDGVTLPGDCVDALSPGELSTAPDSMLLQLDHAQQENEFVLVSHLLRSLCPVTGQPDWASVCLSYTGPALLRESFLSYVLSFRNHQEFHEQCVERMYCDFYSLLQPSRLSVQAFYTRRGGLDICPWRSSEPGTGARYRLARQ